MRKSDTNSLPATLRDALHEMVFESPIPAKAQAEELNVGLSYLYNAANPQLEGFEYQLRLLVQHTRITGNFAALDFLERAVGRVAIPLRRADWPMPRAIALQALTSGLLKATKELGEAAASLHTSLQDGVMNETEARRCRKDVCELLQETTRLYHDLTQLEESFR